MRKKWIAVIICLLMAVSVAGCSVAPAEGDKAPSESPSSETVSNPSSEPEASEPEESQAEESKPEESKPAASEKASSKSPSSEPEGDDSWTSGASTNWSAKLEKETYPIGTETINIILSSGNGVIDSGNLSCLYRLEGEEWKQLIGGVPMTVASPMKPETTMTIPFNVKGFLDTAGKYKVTRHLGGKDAEVTFTVE